VVKATTLPAGIACLLVGTTALAVAPPPRPMTPAALTGLVEQLGDRDFRAREAAERLLHAQGAVALPLLRKALGHRDPEVRRRAMRMVPGMEHALLVAPRRFTLIVENKPLPAVLDELSKASGYKVINNNGIVPGAKANEPRYSFRFLNTTFWDAVDQVCRAANMNVQQSWGDEMVRLQPFGHAPHVGRDGAFRYAANNFQMYRNVDLSAVNPSTSPLPARSENLTFTFTLFAEPRLPFLNLGEIRLDAAYDDERNSLLLRHDATEGPGGGPWGGRMMGRRYYGGGYKQTSIQANVNLQRISEKATTMKQLRGVVPVTLLVEQKPMVISDKILTAKGLKKTVGDLDFHIEAVTKQANNQVSIKFTVTNKGKSDDYMWMNTLYQRIELHDDKGNKYQNWGSSWGGGPGANSAQLTLTFGHFGPAGAKGPTPAKFVYQHWVTRQHDIPFEFRDIPLP
jgi:hypothetical protein